MVEHLSLDTLVGLIDAALVALKAGRLLILETPNPTNVNVGAASFYLDPTHLKPLHPQFLSSWWCQRGFADVEVRYLNAEDAPSLTVDDLAAQRRAGPLAGARRPHQLGAVRPARLRRRRPQGRRRGPTRRSPDPDHLTR